MNVKIIYNATIVIIIILVLIVPLILQKPDFLYRNIDGDRGDVIVCDTAQKPFIIKENKMYLPYLKKFNYIWFVKPNFKSMRPSKQQLDEYYEIYPECKHYFKKTKEGYYMNKYLFEITKKRKGTFIDWFGNKKQEASHHIPIP